MGVRISGQRVSVASIRYALATVLVFLGLSYYFYGPPLTSRLSEAAHDRCNELTGSTYRSYRLEWHTVAYDQLEVPHWVCRDLTRPEAQPVDLGWWVDF